MVSFAALVPYTFSLFITPLHDAFGRKREGISLAFGITAMTVGACSPVSATYSTAIRHEELPCRQKPVSLGRTIAITARPFTAPSPRCILTGTKNWFAL
jgi:hypothetical protein